MTTGLLLAILGLGGLAALNAIVGVYTEGSRYEILIRDVERSALEMQSTFEAQAMAARQAELVGSFHVQHVTNRASA